MTIEKYRENPCRMSSVPYWKVKAYPVPEHINIFHASQDVDLTKYRKVEEYFRLIHRLDQCETESVHIKEIEQADISSLADMMNVCYEKEQIHVNVEEITEWKKRNVYNKNLWIKLESDGKIAASGIAEVDTKVREGMLEWIQVLPEYRRQGYGKMIVQSLLFRLRTMADFVTVSGRIGNLDCPEQLYRSCGFGGNDVWRICYK